MTSKATRKQQLQQKVVTPAFKEEDMVRHKGTGVVGMVHEVMTQDIRQLADGRVVNRQLPHAIYTVVYLDKNGIIHTFQTAERFFEAVE